MAKIVVESGWKRSEAALLLAGMVVFILFCRAGYIVNQEPSPQVYVNGVEIERVK